MQTSLQDEMDFCRHRSHGLVNRFENVQRDLGIPVDYDRIEKHLAKRQNEQNPLSLIRFVRVPLEPSDYVPKPTPSPSAGAEAGYAVPPAAAVGGSTEEKRPRPCGCSCMTGPPGDMGPPGITRLTKILITS